MGKDAGRQEHRCEEQEQRAERGPGAVTGAHEPESTEDATIRPGGCHEGSTMTIDYAADPPGYRPGACNIGPEEIARRRRGGLTGVGMAVAIAIGLVAIGAPDWSTTRPAITPPRAMRMITSVTCPPAAIVIGVPGRPGAFAP